MNLSDLLPGVGSNTMDEVRLLCLLMINQTPINLFHQTLQECQMTPLFYDPGHLKTWGPVPSDGLLDRLANVYLEQLTATSDDRLARFSPEEIRAAIHQLVSYESVEESRRQQEGLPEAHETCPFHFDEDGCVDITGSLAQALHRNRADQHKTTPHFHELMAGHYLLVIGRSPENGFHDQLAQDYLEILQTSRDPRDQLIREKFPLERMKACLHRWIDYEYQPPHPGGGW